MKGLPLEGVLVLEFTQYLSGPSAGLRLADMGARVIKIERPGTGDAGRKLAISDLWADDSSLLFHTINRNKESFVANLKDPADLEVIKKLIAKADVLIHNFRPEVMGKNGLDHATVQSINPRIVYAEISGYGKRGPWKDKPGQDLLLQAMSGLTFTTGNGNGRPVPFGISVGDILAGAHLVQGILGALIRRQKTQKGGLVEVSMMESMLDFQFELLTTYYASGKQPERSALSNGQPLLSAPYGVYATAEGYIAIAMMDLHVLGRAIGCAALLQFKTSEAFSRRDEIKQVIADHLLLQKASYWEELLQEAGLWSAKVLNWQQMRAEPAYQQLQMEQQFVAGGREQTTTRCPMRFNGKRLVHQVPAPKLGAQTESIRKELEQ